jgi:sarcosine oxidase subunit beta
MVQSTPMQSAPVVIIGGGIQGLSLAYHLALLGMDGVCLVERETLGSGSSGKSAAVIGLGFQEEACLPLAAASLVAIQRFEEELGARPDYEPIGSLLLARDHSLSWLMQRHRLLKRMAVESHLLAPASVEALTPGLNLEGIVQALLLPKEGLLDPHSIMMAYATQARRRGVRLLEGVAATGLQIQSGRVTGVETTEGTIPCRWVVNAAGARAQEVAGWAGHSLPITVVKRHIMVTGPVAAYRATIPFTCELDPTWYVRREGPGLLLGMGAAEVEGVDERVEDRAIEALIEYSVFRAPALEDAGLMTTWAGLRPCTPDDLPIMGPVDHLQGYVEDCGWGGHGVMHAPAAGCALAEWIVHGKPAELDLEPFRASRFGLP